MVETLVKPRIWASGISFEINSSVSGLRHILYDSAFAKLLAFLFYDSRDNSSRLMDLCFAWVLGEQKRQGGKSSCTNCLSMPLPPLALPSVSARWQTRMDEPAWRLETRADVILTRIMRHLHAYFLYSLKFGRLWQNSKKCHKFI